MQIDGKQNKWMLAIDTALCGTNLALFRLQSGACHTLFRPDMRGQSAHLIPHIQDLLQQAGCAFSDIGHVVAITGPGSFTGIRVGLAAANALRLGLACTLTGLDAFTAYRLMWPNGNLVVLCETFRDDYFMARYEGQATEMAVAQLVQTEGVPDNITLVGTGLIRLHNKTVEDVKLDWSIILPRIWQSGLIQQSSDLQSLAPYYMRDADTSVSQQQQWRIIK